MKVEQMTTTSVNSYNSSWCMYTFMLDLCTDLQQHNINNTNIPMTICCLEMLSVETFVKASFTFSGTFYCSRHLSQQQHRTILTWLNVYWAVERQCDHPTLCCTKTKITCQIALVFKFCDFIRNKLVKKRGG